MLLGYLALLMALGGFDQWQRLGSVPVAPPLTPSFVDTRVITSAWECQQRDLDVLKTNPCDPWHRPMNYPRIWLAPAIFGITQEATVALGLAVGAIFCVSFLALIGRPSLLEGVAYGLALVSPAVMLGLGVGNVDLLIFALIVGALALLRRSRRSRVLAHGLFLVVAVLKLYPVLAWAVLLRQRRSLRAILPLVILFALYLAATWGDIAAIRAATPQMDVFSYGAQIGVEQLDRNGIIPLVTAAASPVIAAAALSLACGAWLWRGRRSAGAGAFAGSVEVDAFVAGAAIYVGTFMVAQNFDYRLVFLLLTLPQLLAWCDQPRAVPVPVPRLTLIAVFAALWLGEPFSSNGLHTEEIANWFLFLSLGSALAALLLPRGLGRSALGRVAIRGGGHRPGVTVTAANRTQQLPKRAPADP